VLVVMYCYYIAIYILSSELWTPLCVGRQYNSSPPPPPITLWVRGCGEGQCTVHLPPHTHPPTPNIMLPRWGDDESDRARE